MLQIEHRNHSKKQFWAQSCLPPRECTVTSLDHELFLALAIQILEDQDLVIETQLNMWFVYNEAPPYFGLMVGDHLDNFYLKW
jgi:hypothetical protein